MIKYQVLPFASDTPFDLPTTIPATDPDSLVPDGGNIRNIKDIKLLTNYKVSSPAFCFRHALWSHWDQTRLIMVVTFSKAAAATRSCCMVSTLAFPVRNMIFVPLICKCCKSMILPFASFKTCLPGLNISMSTTYIFIFIVYIGGIHAFAQCFWNLTVE